MMSPQQFLSILSIAAKLKVTPRHCFTEENRQESVADHSWRIALMAMLLSGEEDVIVCEGFSGNILLKSLEGAAKSAVAHAKKYASLLPEPERTKMLSDLQKVYLNYDYNSSGGAILLGTNTPVVKGHGSADQDTIHTILTIASELGKKDLDRRIREEFA